jgi:hypothetical protein
MVGAAVGTVAPLLLLVAAADPAAASTDCGRSGLVETVEIVRHEIFDDRDEPLSWPLRLVNRLHPVTREAVIRRELLVAPGECADPEALAQTERNLRRLAFLRDARVEVEPAGNGAVDVRVSTFDAWTTVPLFRLAKVGNRRVWTAGLAERNVLGRGLQVSFVRRADLERDQTIVGLRDPRLFGSRVQARASFAARSDGNRADLEVGRPFFALDTTWAYAARLEAFHQVDPVYDAGERVGNLPHSARRLELEGGRLVRRTATGAIRVNLAYRRWRDTVAADIRRFGVLEANVSLEEHRFLRLTHVNRFEAAEDFNLGHQLAATAAVSEAALGGEGGSTLFLAATERKGVSLGGERFLLGSLEWSGRHRHGRWENAIGEAQVDGFSRLGARAVVLTRAEYRHGSHLDPEVQVTLGAQNGLRGYPVNQWVGTRSLLFAIESRLFVADDIKQLASIGLAAFAEAGYAWPELRPVALRDLRGDAGLGLLIGRNRLTTSRRAIRFDLAYAFNPPPGRGHWLLSAGLEARFLN